jgi:hypothetical protein
VSNPVQHVEEVPAEAGGEIRPAVREHRWSEGLAPRSEEAERQSEAKNRNHQRQTLIAVAESEKRSLNCDGDSSASGETPELLLQIAAENKFFAKTGGDRKRGPERNFRSGASSKMSRKKLLQRL